MLPASYLPDHEAGDVLKEEKRMLRWLAELDEMRALERALAEQDPVVRDDANGQAVDVGEAADQRLPYSALNSSSSDLSTMRAITSRTS